MIFHRMGFIAAGARHDKGLSVYMYVIYNRCLFYVANNMLTSEDKHLFLINLLFFDLTNEQIQSYTNKYKYIIVGYAINYVQKNM